MKTPKVSEKLIEIEKKDPERAATMRWALGEKLHRTDKATSRKGTGTLESRTSVDEWLDMEDVNIGSWRDLYEMKCCSCGNSFKRSLHHYFLEDTESRILCEKCAAKSGSRNEIYLSSIIKAGVKSIENNLIDLYEQIQSQADKHNRNTGFNGECMIKDTFGRTPFSVDEYEPIKLRISRQELRNVGLEDRMNEGGRFVEMDLAIPSINYFMEYGTEETHKNREFYDQLKKQYTEKKGGHIDNIWGVAITKDNRPKDIPGEQVQCQCPAYITRTADSNNEMNVFTNMTNFAEMESFGLKDAAKKCLFSIYFRILDNLERRADEQDCKKVIFRRFLKAARQAQQHVSNIEDETSYPEVLLRAFEDINVDMREAEKLTDWNTKKLEESKTVSYEDL